MRGAGIPCPSPWLALLISAFVLILSFQDILDEIASFFESFLKHRYAVLKVGFRRHQNHPPPGKDSLLWRFESAFVFRA